MNWPFIRRVALIPCIGTVLIVLLTLVDARWPLNPKPAFQGFLLVAILIAFNLVLPSWLIGTRTTSARFLSGCSVVAIGSTYGFAGGFAVSIAGSQLLPNVTELMHRGLGQGIGVGLLALWVIGMLSSPATGLLSVLLGMLVRKKQLEAS